jgi:hypothetical protein
MKIVSIFKSKSSENLISLVLSSLLIVYPIAHTIAIRYFLYAAILLIAIFYIKKIDKNFLLLILTFYLWLILEIIFFSQVPEISLEDLKGAWLRFFLAIVAGVVAGRNHFFERKVTVYILDIFLVLLIINFILIKTNLFNFNIYDRKHGVAFIFGLLILIAHEKITGNKLKYYLVMVLTESRSMLISLMVSVFKISKRLDKFYIVIAIIIGIIFNNAWSGIYHDVKAGITLTGEAWHGNKNTNDVGWPTIDGQKISRASNYERPAWIVSGLVFSINYPMGYGALHDSYKRVTALEIEDSDPRYASSHSGLIDMLLAIGYPGTVIFIIIIYLSINKSRIPNKKQVLLYLLIASILDATTRDELLEIMGFLIGYSYLHEKIDNLYTNVQ